MVSGQIKRDYTTKHPRLRAYKNDALDLLNTFMEYELVYVPRSQNILANGLAYVASSRQRPHDEKQFIFQTKYRPTMPDNEKYW